MDKAARILLAVVSCVPVVAVATGGVAAAEQCLVAPGSQTPKGQQWSYRLERGTGRQCWYLRQEGVSSSPAAATLVPLPVERPLINENAIAKSIADAHDELPQPPASTEDAGKARMSIPDSSVGSGQDIQNFAPAPNQQLMSVASNATDARQQPSTRVEGPVSVKAFVVMVFGALALCELASNALFPLRRRRRRPQTRSSLRHELDRPRSRSADPAYSPRRIAPAPPVADRPRQPVNHDDRVHQVERLLAQMADGRRPPVQRSASRGRTSAAH
ncbi:hypothetical protein [Bradyrhizobium sp.]|uniref:hypothetical protein n=1 Tax=Bradyrhizobium sp. TaxID=376 RepID=UPI003C54131D